MSLPSPDEKPRGLRDWMDSARLVHLRQNRWFALFDERYERHIRNIPFLAPTYRTTFGEMAMFLAFLAWVDYSCLCYAILGAALLLPLAGALRWWARPIEGERLPLRLIEVLHPYWPRVDVARDLWLAGLNGWDAAVTLYGELRRHHLTFCGIAFFVWCARDIVQPLRTWLSTAPIEMIGAVLLPELTVLLAKAAYLYASMGMATAYLGLRPYVETWRGNSPGVMAHLRPALFLFVPLILIPVLEGLRYLAAPQFAGMFDQVMLGLAPTDDRELFSLGGQLVYGAVTIVVYTIPLLLVACRMSLANARMLEGELLIANDAFERWIQRQGETA